jgi:hypothetical protein
MKINTLNLASIILLFVSVSCGKNESVYSRNLKSSVNKMIANQALTDDELLAIIPSTKEEFSEYYSYTYPDKEDSVHKAFYQIDNLLIKNANQNINGFLKKYLELAKFVDGEYAESYLEESNSIISKNSNSFCELYDELDVRTKEFFEDQYLDNCKK